MSKITDLANKFLRKDDQNKEPQIADALQFVLHNNDKAYMELMEKQVIPQEQLVEYITKKYNLKGVQPQAIMELSKKVYSLPIQEYLREKKDKDGNIQDGVAKIVNKMIEQATTTAEITSRARGEEVLSQKDVESELSEIEIWRIVVEDLNQEKKQGQGQEQEEQSI